MPWLTTGYDAWQNTPYIEQYHWNQRAGRIRNVPANTAITKVKARAAGYGGSVATRLAVWAFDGDRDFLGMSTEFTMGTSVTWHERELIDPIPIAVQQDVLAGIFHDNTQHGSQMASTQNGLLYEKHGNYPNPDNMINASTRSDRNPHVEIFYILTPNAPTDVNATYVSDTRINLNWATSSNDDRPITNIRIERQINGGGYSHLTTLSGSATSFSDQTTTAGNAYRYRIRTENAAGVSSWVYTDTIKTTPNPPTNINISRVSDTRHDVTWSLGANASHTYDTIRAQRRINSTGSWGSWSTIATLSGTATSYSDTGTVANRAYQWRVRAENSNGSSSYTESDVFKTTPAAPSDINVTQQGTNMAVSWTNNAPLADRLRIEHRVNSGSWTVLDSNLNPTTTSYTHQNPGAGHHQYRVRAEVTTPNLSSSYATSAEIRFTLSPQAPSNVAVSRINDAQQSLSWTNNATPERPYDTIRIQRWDNVTGSYYNLATISGNNTSFTDNTTQSNHRYRYRVRAENTAGESSYVTSNYIYTTPATPTDVTATRDGLDVNITWANPATAAVGVQVERRTDGGSWSLIATLSGTATSYKDVEPGGGVHRYRVRTYVDDPTLYSTWAESADVLTLMPPNPPSNLSPSNITIDRAEQTVFAWQYNTADGTAQTAYEIQYRIVGGSWATTGKITSGNHQHTFPAETFTGSSYEWRVRTWGTHDDPSNWSSVATFIASYKPTCIITYPTTDIPHTLPEINMQWLYNDVDGDLQDRFRVTIFSGGMQIYQTTQVGSVTEFVPDFTLLNNQNYTIQLEVRNNKGLWSQPTSVTFAVEYNQPPIPDLSITFDKTTGAATITVINPEPEGDQPDTAYNRIYKLVEGEWILFADNIPKNGTVVDYIPIVDTKSIYFVTAVSDLPSITNSFTVDVETEAVGYYYLNAGQNWSEYIILSKSPQVRETFGRAGVRQQFYGRRYPVLYQSDEFSHILNLTALVTLDELPQLKRIIMELPGPVFYRDYTGRWFPAQVENPQLTKVEYDLYQFSCNLVRVEL